MTDTRSDPPVPTTFADGILNLAYTNHLVKFFLGRMDPAANGVSKQSVVVGQVVMPTDSFVQAFVFFEARISHMVADAVLSADQSAHGGSGPDGTKADPLKTSQGRRDA